ncbi:hypothetical protein AVEN_268890-1 [Araneus ventricosus]|uniref:Uncharacterized protein n=1 Tax=Araneus ventricosus TaxID=182803 RepID=A0A4Y2PBP2_ARAVE|nr:hypothetical protein AVEN_268890-1 [Araneus ventricosus]
MSRYSLKAEDLVDKWNSTLSFSSRWLWHETVAGLRPDTTKTPQCTGPWCILNPFWIKNCSTAQASIFVGVVFIKGAHYVFAIRNNILELSFLVPENNVEWFS